MHANSRSISSAQTEIHAHLYHLIDRHANTPFQKPVLDYNRAAFESAMSTWRNAGCAPLILDAGCGVGLSTFNLAAQNPDFFVIGVDQSAHRLARNTRWKGSEPPSNCIRIRADLVDFWRLMLASDVRPARQYLLYPNPWPKIGHLGRRWHGHPVFPTMVALGGEFECRSNWSIYVQECAAALTRLTGKQVVGESFTAANPISPFEHKYAASGHTLWRCQAHLTSRVP